MVTVELQKIAIETDVVLAEYASVEEAARSNFMKIGELLEHLHGWIEHNDDFYFRYKK